MAAAMLLAAIFAVLPLGRQAGAQAQANYIVVYANGVSAEAARNAIIAAGGIIVSENTAVGVASVASENPQFLDAVNQQAALFGAARNLPVAQIEPNQVLKQDEVEGLIEEGQLRKVDPGTGPVDRSGGQAGIDPLAYLQWDMDMIHANASGSHAVQAGDERVLVGIIDSGIDASHPDLAPNFSWDLSRNFATDIELIDGPCEYPGCVDPPYVDNNGHGSHVAGTVAAALNGIGIAGIAPNVTLVNIRGGQDSGYVFLLPVVNALVYAGDIGVDVVNMSFYIDPWLYNCTNNPADSPEDQMEQQAIIEATERAMNYARDKGVAMTVSAGNNHIDLGNPTFDNSSPDYPPGEAYDRTVDNSCRTMPVEADAAIVVSALGPTKVKADYSNYGVEQTNVSAPGGHFRDYLGTPQYRTFSNLVLSTFPQSVLEESGLLDPDGNPLTDQVVRDCQSGVCAYYMYLQGTSMAAPHAAGVAALIVSQYGKLDPLHPGGIRFNPRSTKIILERSATNTPCPDPRLFSYTNVGRPASWDAYCDGEASFNGFYGEGIVDALRAVTNPKGQ
jgi:subtilisin family serine protease